MNLSPAFHVVGLIMPARRTRHLCHYCCIALSRDDREHYAYLCHACAAREHDLTRLAKADPAHPDLLWLEASPVDLGRTPKTGGTGA